MLTYVGVLYGALFPGEVLKWPVQVAHLINTKDLDSTPGLPGVPSNSQRGISAIPPLLLTQKLRFRPFYSNPKTAVTKVPIA